MTINPVLMEVKDRGWLNGFGPLWLKENHRWWGTGSWLVKIFIWIVIVDGILATTVFARPETGVSQGSLAETGETALGVYFIIAGMVPALVMVIFGQDTIIDERKAGTAAWVLSKPVSRAAFLLSKLSADALGVLATMVLVQGVIAHFIYKAGTGISLPIPGFLAALGLVYLFIIFYLALSLMLAILFHSRGPVIGIPLALIAVSYPAIFVPWLGKAMPSSLFLNPVSGQPPLATALALGQPLPTVIPVFSTGFLVILFIIVALVRFEREEF